MRLAVLFFVIPAVGHAQDSIRTRHGPSHWHIGITYHDYGITVGNAARTNGLRLNFEDVDLERVNGINLTIWKPRDPVSGTISGLALGLAPGAEDLNGIAIGLGGVVAEHRARWVTIGGLGAVSNGRLEGIALGGLGTVANSDITGIAIGGLAVVANDELRGVGLAGYTVDAPRIQGLSTSLYVKTRGLRGLSVAAYNRVRGLQVGITGSTIRRVSSRGYSWA